MARMKSSRSAWLKLGLAMLVGLGAGVGLFVATLRPAPAPSAASTSAQLTDLNGLFNQSSEVFTTDALKGRYVLMYFGFTHCPDACPTALYNATLALQQLDADATRIQPMFITIDPKRDTPALLALYLANFSAQWWGLSGAPEQLQSVWARFGIIAIEHRDDNVPDGYTMDHSDEFLLWSPNGRLLMRLPANVSGDTLLEQLRALTRAETV